ncbi:MAG: ABC transporter permease, partial [Boseongicola sp. SB0670_bin_30]|nr:ABC transporter permease [Boseongicola sp. SB0670_bin_30]
MPNAFRTAAGMTGLGLLLLVMGAATLGPFLAPYDPQAFHPAARLQGPSAAHWLGTDQFGRDLLS